MEGGNNDNAGLGTSRPETGPQSSSNEGSLASAMRTFLEEWKKGNTSASATESSAEKPISYKDFKECDPSKFSGQKDVVLTHKWIREMESAFKLSKCKENQKVGFAVHSFQADALFWWDTIEQSMGEEEISAMTWKEFKELVMGKFCPRSDLDRMESKFLQLQAGSMGHKEYTARFEEMARIVPHLVVPESKKIMRYIQGLPSRVRMMVKAITPTSYQTVVNFAAEMYEEVYGSDRPATERENVSRRIESSGSKFTPRSGSQSSRGSQSSSSSDRKRKFDQRDNRRAPPRCNNCRKFHWGECKSQGQSCYRCGKPGHFANHCPDNQCFNCGEMGHMKSVCPKLGNNPAPIKSVPGRKAIADDSSSTGGAVGRAFTMTTEEARNLPDVVSGSGSRREGKAPQS